MAKKKLFSQNRSVNEMLFVARSCLEYGQLPKRTWTVHCRSSLQKGSIRRTALWNSGRASPLCLRRFLGWKPQPQLSFTISNDRPYESAVMKRTLQQTYEYGEGVCSMLEPIREPLDLILQCFRRDNQSCDGEQESSEHSRWTTRKQRHLAKLDT